MPKHIEIYHCEFGHVETLRTDQIKFADMQTLCTMQSVPDDLDLAIDHAMVTYPPEFQDQNPAPSYLVTYRHKTYISPYYAYGTFKEALRCVTSIMASKLTPFGG